MIDGYMNIKEAADKWDISTRRVQILCAEGRIDGASKLGREWAIPINASKPADQRFTSGEYKDWRSSKQHIVMNNTGEKL